MMQPAAAVCSQSVESGVGEIYWNEEKKKYDLIAGGKFLVSSKNADYLNYLVVKQKHPTTVGLTSTIIVKEKCAVVPEFHHHVAPDQTNELGLSSFALGCVNAELQQSIETGEKPNFTRPRGRPRKHFSMVENLHTHTLEDSDRDIRILMPMTKHKIILDFKEYLEEGSTPKTALENICKLYNITYFQAFSICERHM